jgi:hypothetical protein
LALGLLAMVFSSAVLAQVEPTWVKQGVEWGQYGKFLVKPLDVGDLKVIKPAWAQDDPAEWSLSMEDLAGIQAIFRDVMGDVLAGNGGYPLVHTEGHDVLEVRVELLSITPWVKPGGDKDLAGLQVTTLGSGEIAASVELRDSATRELLMLIEGDKAVGEQYTQYSRANNIANVESMFRSFATRLRGAMDKVHGK